MSFGGGGGDDGSAALVAQQQREAAEAARREALRQQRIQAGATQISNMFDTFDDDFYNNYGSSYDAYYTPEIQRQYDQSREQLTFDAARSGLLNSSITTAAQADLARQLAEQQGIFGAQRDSEIGALRNQVADQRQAAFNQLYSSQDPDIAASNATGIVKNLTRSTPEFNAVGSLFNVANLGLKGLQNFAEQTRPYRSPYQQSDSRTFSRTT